IRTRETFHNLGIPFEKLTTSELGERYPQMGLDRISWAMLELEGGVLFARKAVQAVVREAIRIGVEYLAEAVSGPGVPPVIHAQDVRATRQKVDDIVTENGRRI